MIPEVHKIYWSYLIFWIYCLRQLGVSIPIEFTLRVMLDIGMKEASQRACKPASRSLSLSFGYRGFVPATKGNDAVRVVGVGVTTKVLERQRVLTSPNGAVVPAVIGPHGCALAVPAACSFVVGEQVALRLISILPR